MKRKSGKTIGLAWLLVLTMLASMVPAYAAGTGYNKSDYHLESDHFIWTVDEAQNQSGLDGSTALGWDYLLNSISPSNFNTWIGNLDKAYEAYEGLVGGTPAGGAKLKLVKDTTHTGAWAFVMGSDYVFWNQNVITSALKDIERTGGVDSCRGILHEVGHLFDIGGWAFNPECFANFKMYYAMEKAGLTAFNTSGTMQTGKEQWDFYYGAAQTDFAKNPTTIKIFDGDATAEPPLLVLGAIFESLGGWTASSGATGYQGWDVFQKVFLSYNDPNYQADGYYSKDASVGGKDYNTVRELLRRLNEFSGQDIYGLVPAGVKTQVENRYFPLDATTGWKPNVVEYQSPTGIVSSGSGGLTLTFDRSVAPVAGKTLHIDLFDCAFRYEADGTAVPYLSGNGYYPFLYTMTGSESVTGSGSSYQLTIPFSEIKANGGLPLSAALDGAGIARNGRAAKVYLDEGAFTHTGGSTPARNWGAAFFRKAYDMPAVSSSEPVNKAVGVAASGSLTLHFSAQMDQKKGSVSLDQVPLTGGRWSEDGLVFTVPYSGLADSIAYTAQFSGFQDPYGNAAPTYGISFTRAAIFPDTSETVDLSALTGDQTWPSLSYDQASQTLTLKQGTNVTLRGTVSDGRHVVVADDAGTVSITLDGLSISTQDVTALALGSGNQATVTLAAGSVNKLSASGNDTSGLRIARGTSLILDGKGTLEASSGLHWPGIGGYGDDGQSITINDGSITATGGGNGAGIGGSNGGGGIAVTINGGNVHAAGGSNAAGIGGGIGYGDATVVINDGDVEASASQGAGIGGGASAKAGASTHITINGGTVKTASSSGAGIGSGEQAAGATDITITDGTVTALGAAGAGIGAGNNAQTSSTLGITINGGGVAATGSDDAAAIGGGKNGASGTIQVNGGTIIATAKGKQVGIGSGYLAAVGTSGSGPNAITINGGTIDIVCEPDRDDPYVYPDYKNEAKLGGKQMSPKLTINGGSLCLDREDDRRAKDWIAVEGGNIKNAAGEALYLMTAYLGDNDHKLELTGTAITGGTIGDIICSSLFSSSDAPPSGYGIYDVTTIGIYGAPAVFFWLPEAKEPEPFILSAGGDRYLGSFTRPQEMNQANLYINTWKIGLSQIEALAFEKQAPGYAPVAAQTITVTNQGNVETGELRVGLSGTDTAGFELAGARQESSTGISGLLLDSIPAGGSATFTIKPKDGLTGRTETYAATVSVTGEHSITGSFDVSFVVNTTPSTVTVTQPAALAYPEAGSIQVNVSPAPTGANRGTVTLYLGDTAVSEAVPVGDDGASAITLATDGKKLSIGVNSLVARYSGNTAQKGADSAEFTVTVDPKALTATATPSKIYDGSTDFTGVPLALSGVQPGDTVTGSMAGTASSANVGSSGFTVGERSLSGVDAGWYTLAQSAVTAATATITAKPVTVTISGPESHEYTGTAGDASHTAGYDTVNGDTANAAVLYDDSETKPTDVKSGGYALTVRMKDPNYTAQTVTGVKSFTITPAALSVSTDTKALTILCTNTEVQTVIADDFGITQPGGFALNGSVTDADGILNTTPTAGNTVSFQLKADLTGAEGTATIPVTFTPTSGNYQAKDLTITVALRARADVSGTITFAEGTAVYTGMAQLHETATIPGLAGTFTYTYAALPDSALTDGKPVDVGGYTVTAVYDDEENHGEKSAVFTITQATPTIDPAPTATGKLYVNSPLSSLTLTGGKASTGGAFVFRTPETTFDAGGSHTVKVVFTPTDTKNYTTAETDISVTAVKRTAQSVGALAAITDRPFGTAQTELGLPETAALTTADGKVFDEIPVTWGGYRSDTLESQALTGTLDLTAIAAEVVQPEPPVTASISVTLRALAPGAVAFEDHTATYTGQPIAHTLSETPLGVASISYSYAGTGETIYPADAQAPTHAGTYTVTASFAVQAGYAPIGAKTVDLTIVPKPLADGMIQAIPEQRYMGDSIHPAVTVQDGETVLAGGAAYTVAYGENTEAGAGSVTITGTGDYTGTAQATFNIIKSDAAMTVTPDSNTITFGDPLTVQISGIAAARLRSNEIGLNTVALYVGSAEGDPIATAAVNGAAATLTYDTRGKALAVGENTLFVRYGGSGNLNAYVSEPFTVTLNKATPACVPPTGLTATFGDTLAAAALPSGWAWDDPLTTPVGGAGSRIFQVTYTSPTDTDFYNTVPATVTIAVGKAAAPQVADLSASFRYTLTGAQTQGLAKLLPGDRGETGYQLGGATGDTGILTDGGVSADGTLTYTLTGAGAAGNTAVLPVTVTMENYETTAIALTVTLTALDVPTVTAEDITVTYGQPLTITGTAVFGGGAVAGGWSFKDIAPADAGAYEAVTVIFTPTESGIYARAEAAITVIIHQAEPEYTAPRGATATYGQTLAQAAIGTPGTGDGTWSWTAPGTQVGSVGSHNFSMTFTPADSKNYKTVTDVPVTVTVGKADPAAQTPTGLTATFGQILSNVSLPEGWSWDDPSAAVGNAGENTFPATYTPEDTDNYDLLHERLIVAVAQKHLDDVAQAASFRYTLTGEQTLDLAALLPGDRGETSYQLGGVTGDTGILTDGGVSAEGVLTYALTGTGAADDTAVLPVTVTMENYETMNITLTVTLVDKDVPEIHAEDIAVTYGEELVIHGTATFDGDEVTGRWSFDFEPSEAGEHSAAVVFTPDDTNNFAEATTSITVVIHQAEPEYTAPYGVTAVYGQTLAQAVVGAPGTGDGTWSWTAPNDLVGDAGERHHTMIFVPRDVNYKTVTDVPVAVQVDKADPVAEAPMDLTATFGDMLGAVALPDGWAWDAPDTIVGDAGAHDFVLTFTPEDTENYNTVEATVSVTVGKAAAPVVPLQIDTVFAADSGTRDLDLASLLPADRGETRYTVGDVTGSAGILNGVDVSDAGLLSYTLTGTGKAGDVMVIPITAVMSNYEDVTILLSVTLTDKDRPAVTAGDITAVYGQTLKIAGTAVFDGAEVAGTWGFREAAPVDAGTYRGVVVVFTPEDSSRFGSAEAAITVTITKADVTGAPRYTPITTGGKTLTDAALSTEGDAFSVKGAVKWVDQDGKELPGDTAVAANTSYTWLFVPDDADNYNTLTGSLILYTVSTSGGGSSSSGNKTETEKHPDGSTTTTVTDKRTGTVTETTKKPDGSQTIVETKKDGTKTEIQRDTKGNRTETVTKPDGSMTYEASTADGVRAQAEKTADGETVATVTIPEKAVGADRTVTLPIPAVKAESAAEKAPTVTVTAPGQAAVKIEVPVENATAGTVAVLVKPDGAEVILKTSVATKTGLIMDVTGEATVKIVDNTKTFNDVPADSWANESVTFTAARGLFSGTGEAMFSPDQPMDRAMLVTVLARLDDQDTTASEGGTWYDKGMAWAKEQGISDGSAPKSDVTREQLVTMLYRFAGSPAVEGAPLSAFSDGDAVSDYAKSAMGWAVRQGILTGKDGRRLDPDGNATRAEVAAILQRFIMGNQI